MPSTYSVGSCCSDPAVPITNIHVTVYTDQGVKIKTVSESNNSSFDCGEFNPGNYKAEIIGTYTLKEDHSMIAPCGDCYGGTASHGVSSILFQIVANKDITITCQ